MLRAKSILIAMSAGVLIFNTPAAFADCLELDRELRSTVSAGHLEKFEGIYKKIVGEPTCDGRYRARAGRLMALASLRAFSRRPGSAHVARPELERAASYGQPWQLMQVLGDVYYAQKNYPRAVQSYETALDDIRDVSVNPKAPPRAVEVRIAKLAYQARALAPQYVATRTWRGRPSGLASPKFRNFTAVSVPVPVRFEYNKSALTADGEAAGKDILRFFVDQGSPSVRLIGHTDPIGAADYNMGLSIARAESLRAYMLAEGYKGKILVEGKGKSKPFEPDDPTKYTDEERHKFDRRVEYQVLSQK